MIMNNPGSIGSVATTALNNINSNNKKSNKERYNERQQNAARRDRASYDGRGRAPYGGLDDRFTFFGMLTCDGILIEASISALEASGLTSAELLGQPFEKTCWWAWSPEAQERLRKAVRLAALGERVRFEAQIQIAEGRLKTVDFTLAPLVDAAGRVAHILATGTEISARRSLEAESALAQERAGRERAEAGLRARDEVIAIIAHELRAPLNSIIGWNRMLEARAGADEGVAKITRIIDRNARSQLQLVEELLDSASIMSGKLRLDLQPLDLAAVISAAIEVVSPSAYSKRISLDVSIDPQAKTILGDPMRWQQIIWNLLVNAVEFTPEGGRVRISLERAGERVRIAVSDTGRGIAPDFLPFVFDRFRQAEPAAGRRRGGLGLGLSLVRHLVEMHGGTVAAESAGAGKGATFIVLVPARAGKERAPTGAVTEALPLVGR